jgi:phosphatidylserine/phosphatidylglycerophosphate/cardiolipin synthase-like enzyme
MTMGTTFFCVGDAQTPPEQNGKLHYTLLASATDSSQQGISMRHYLLVFNRPFLIGLTIGLVFGLASGTLQLPDFGREEGKPIQGAMRVWFSPGSSCNEAAIAAIDAAEKSIAVMATDFTSTPIAQALCGAAARGVKIDVLADKPPLNRRTTLPQLVHGNAQVCIDDVHHFAHSQVMVIDKKIVVTGSFNWTVNADVGNDENLLIVDSPDLAAAYLKDWDEHRHHSKPFEWNLMKCAWVLATDADPKFRSPCVAADLAQQGVKLEPSNWGWWNTLGAAQYCAGDWKAAVTALEKSTTLRQGGDSFDWFFLAMAHYQLAQKVEARRWYDKAVEWMDKNKPQDPELRRFRAEAADLLGLKDKSSSEKRPLPKPDAT